MDQVGPADKPIDRILLFRDGKDPVVFAEKLNAIFGMAWHDGALYVMNMPHLTVLRDTDGDGKADERKDLFTDLGVPAGSPTGLNDHIVSGLQFGIDGYLYISVGDKGVPKATGPDGRTAQVIGGGIAPLPARRHRASRSSPPAPATTSSPTSTTATTSSPTTTPTTASAGGPASPTTSTAATTATPTTTTTAPTGCSPGWPSTAAAPPAAASSTRRTPGPRSTAAGVFWAEWGKRQVHAFRFDPDGATLQGRRRRSTSSSPATSSDFRPLDLALSYDGKTLYVADWGMGGWGNKTEKVGRVYAVTYKGEVKTRPRGKDSDPIDAQIKAARPPLVQRADAGADGADQAGARRRSAGRRRGPGRPEDRPGRQAAPGLGRRRDRRRHARGDRAR